MAATNNKELTVATARKPPRTSGRNGGNPKKIEPDGDAKVNKAERTSLLGRPFPAGKPLDEERIRVLAYNIWIEEGQPQGRDVDHWMRARGELERKAA